MHPRYFCALLALLLLSSRALSQTAEFPASSSTAAQAHPVNSNSVCGTSGLSTYCPAGVYSGPSCLYCNTLCPFGLNSTAAIANFSTLAQAECVCSSPRPVVSADQCCSASTPSDCVSRLNTDAHPVQHAVDTSTSTYFQSSTNQTTVNVTVDLYTEFEIFQISAKFSGFSPVAFLFLRSADGLSFTPYQYYSTDCSLYFKLVDDKRPTTVDEAVCSVLQAPLDQNPTLAFSLLTASRISLATDGSSYPVSEALQKYTRARYVRIQMVMFQTPATAVDYAGTQYDAPPFYRLANLAVNGRCSCNGHASECVGTGAAIACNCVHNTAGPQCRACLPLYNAKPWARGILNNASNDCVKCECNDHATTCHYDSSYDTVPSSRTLGDGGVCDNCADNTGGQHCESCATSFYKNLLVPRNSKAACLACDCFAAGSKGSSCDVETGQCVCKANTVTRDCSACKPEYYGLSASKVDGCTACACNTYGTINGSNSCDAITGQCPCLDSNTGRACDQCKVGYYVPVQGVTGQCSKCHGECSDQGCIAAGPSTASCLSCRHFAENNLCVSNCSSFKYGDVYSVCQTCSAQCSQGCSGPDPNTKDCVACLNYEYNGECVSTCPSHTFPSANRTCEACHTECLSCTGAGADHCVACRSYTDGSFCVDSCPLGKYPDSKRVCRPCSPLCHPDYGCSGPSNSECKRCKTYTVLDDSLHEKICLASCPSFTYLTGEDLGSGEGSGIVNNKTTDNVCSACHTECLSACDGPTNFDCIGECRHYKYQGGCVAGCPSHTYLSTVSGTKYCLPCSSACDKNAGCFGPDETMCVSCSAASVSFNSTCISSCPTGYYPDDQRICRPCDSNCVTCLGPGSFNCTSCSRYAYKTLCVASCPLGTYHSLVPSLNPSSSLTCLSCHEECVGGCSGGNSTQCTSCLNYDYQDACISSCPAMTYPSGSQCLPCSTQCVDGCTGPGVNQCLNCKNYLSGSDCVATCKPSEYVAANRTCASCHSECSVSVPGCTGPSSSQCSACAHFRNPLDGTCVPYCPHQTYSSGVDCLPCHSQCDGCTGPLATQCKSCRSFFDSTGACVSTCPTGTYANALDVCVPCNTECAGACYGPDPNQCLALTNGSSPCAHFHSNLMCVAQCDAGSQYANGSACMFCSLQCGSLGCTGPLPSQCRNCKSASLAGTCVSSCPYSHYLDVSGTCSPCNSLCTGSLSPNTSLPLPFCFGPSASECNSCLKFQDGSTCVNNCNALTQYTQGKTCLSCDVQCSQGCSGAGPTLCNSCANWLSNGVCVTLCPSDTTYSDVTTKTCMPCDLQCNVDRGVGGCPSGSSSSDCAQCLNFRENGACVASCGIGYYPDTSDLSAALKGVCKPCHAECKSFRGCFGPNATDCNTCAHYSYLGVCVNSCPPLTVSINGSCIGCNSNCLYGCTGTNPDQCTYSSTVVATNATYYGCKAVVDLVSPKFGVPTCKRQCDLGYYPDSNGICQGCSLDCPLLYGCTAPGASGCAKCPTNNYLNKDRLCDACDGQCKGGCSGSGADHCSACVGAKKDGVCVSDCTPWTQSYYTDTTQPNNTLCLPCHSECAVGGCTGPLSSDCSFGCKNYVTFLNSPSPSGSCVPDCGSNSYSDDTPQRKTCHTCSSLCIGGCTGPLASQCVACSFAKRNGVCVSACAANEVVSNGVCTCPTLSAYVSGSSCLPCSSECTLGCTGPNPNQCLGGVSGCRTAMSRDGVCVTQCPTNEVKSSDKTCTCPADRAYLDGSGVCQTCHPQCYGGCRGGSASQCASCKFVRSRQNECTDTCAANEVVSSNYLCTCPESSAFVNTTDNSCQLCSSQCASGCSGPSANQCNSCRTVKSGDTCLATCPLGLAPANKVCASCHAECANGCSLPGNPLYCVSCKTYRDQGLCVSTCPLERYFVSNGVCVSNCPFDKEFYNDTRDAFGVSTMPQLCVSDCQLLEGKTYSSGGANKRCSSQEQVSMDASSSSSDSTNDKLVIVGAVVGGVAVLVLIIAVVIVLRRSRDRRRQHPVSDQGSVRGGPYGQSDRSIRPQSPSVKSTQSSKYGHIYDRPMDLTGPSSNAGKGRDTFDPVYIMAEGSSQPKSPTYLSLGDLNTNDTYLEVNTMRRNDPYSMQNDALFDSPKNVQSTRM